MFPLPVPHPSHLSRLPVSLWHILVVELLHSNRDEAWKMLPRKLPQKLHVAARSWVGWNLSRRQLRWQLLGEAMSC